MELICEQEVASLLEKQAVSIIEEDVEGFYSSLFAIPKKSGGFRPIINLKYLNKFIKYEHFKMENLNSLKHVIRQRDWFLKLDLKDAYLTVPINAIHKKFLRFKWKNKTYQFNCLPFGLSCAPRVFTKLLKPIISFLRRRGIRLIIYLDDILILDQSEEGVIRAFKFTVHLLQFLGFVINWEKTIQVPVQRIEFLGLLVDSISLSFSLPPEKISKIRLLCAKALSNSKTSLRNLSAILGNFSWCIAAVPFAQAHYRKFQNFHY